jgi:hypothetical protein
VATGSEGNGPFSWTGPGSFSHEDAFPGSELVDPTPSTPSIPRPFAYRRNLPQPNGVTRGQVLVEEVPGASGPLAVNTSAHSVAHPSIDASNEHLRIVYDIRTVDSAGKLEQGDIGYCLIFLHNGSPCGLGQGLLPPLVNSARDETRTNLAVAAPIGLFVQHVVGHHRLLGRRVPSLKPVGRIPLGQFRRGRHKIHWQAVVNGRHLRRGLYQFTVRALTKSGKIRDLGKPRQLRVRTGGG